MRPLIVVAGDTLLDVDCFVEASRTTDDGLPIVQGEEAWTSQFGTKLDYAAFNCRTEHRLGGAAAVARMAYGLGASVLLLTNSVTANQRHSLFGDVFRKPDDDGRFIWSVPIVAPGVPSTKRRLICDGAPRLRVDIDQRVELPRINDEVRKRIMNRSPSVPETQKVQLIFSDYGKGLLDSPEAIQDIIDVVEPDEIFVDPHHTRDITSGHFGACSVMALPWRMYCPSESRWPTGADRLLVKRGADGMGLVVRDRGLWKDVGPDDIQWGQQQPMCDPCGCGDMAIAAFAVARGESLSWADATRFAACAAAEETLVWGANPVSRAVVDARFNRG